jgi:hypothetical protein
MQPRLSISPDLSQRLGRIATGTLTTVGRMSMVAFTLSTMWAAPFGPTSNGVAMAAEDTAPTCEVRQISSEEIESIRTKYATQLANALGKNPMQVIAALDKMPSMVKPVEVKITPADIFAPAAAYLGVTPQELEEAMHDAAPKPLEGAKECKVVRIESGAVSGAGGPGFAVGGATTQGFAISGTPAPSDMLFTAKPAITFGIVKHVEGGDANVTFSMATPGGNSSEFFGAIAQKLGRGITAQQVEEAFKLMKPPSLTTAPATGPSDYIKTLAGLLGVMPEQLETAMKGSNGGPGIMIAKPFQVTASAQ